MAEVVPGGGDRWGRRGAQRPQTGRNPLKIQLEAVLNCRQMRNVHLGHPEIASFVT